MDMIERLKNIRAFQNDVTRRLRGLELQDSLVLALGAGAIVSAAVVLIVRLRPLQIPVWPVVLGLMGAAVVAGVIAWFYRRTTERAALFMIDGALGLEDRLITAAAIDSNGGPRQPMEYALIEDAAARIEDKKASSIAPYRRPRHLSYSLIGLVALAVAVAIPQKALPQSEEAIMARADIQSAGEMLEQSAEQIGEAIEPGTTTAQLAKEQADLGRMLKASGEDRAEALKKLSALGDRIQQRHRELQETRADEIVSLADQKLRAALDPRSKSKRAGKDAASDSRADEGLKDAPEAGDTKKADANKATSDERASEETRGQSEASKEPAASNKPQADKRNGNVAGENADAAQAGAEGQNRPQEPVSGREGEASSTPQAGGAQGQAAQQQNPDEARGQGQQGEQSDPQSKTGELAGALAGQAAKAMPGLSEQLLQKAGELRANQLDPESIAALARAAGSLAKDLSSIAQSKDFQQALEQLARQVNPEQLEQVARELMKNEELMRELRSAARLLAENQQAKQLVAGLARSFGAGREREQAGAQGQPSGQGQSRQDQPGEGIGRGSALSQATNRSDGLKGRGRDVRASANARRGSGGEYLYLPSKAGTGSARAPYSTAYPQYRREAERAVRRSQVPPHLRSVVRSYFDAINPDGKKN
jgi:hypothetical protein